MKKIQLLTFIILISILFTSCELAVFSEDPAKTPTATFEYLWNKVDQQYAYFDVKNVDWDEIYQEYSSLIDDNMSDNTLFYYLAKMLNTLKDGHVNLFSDFNISRFNITGLGPQNINWRFVKDNYLGDDYYTTGAFSHDFIANNKIAYLRYASFSNLFSSADMEYIFKRYKDTQGMILDLRQNGGGYMLNIFELLSYFSFYDGAIYTTCIKSGPGHEEFTQPENIYIEAADSSLHYQKPVAVLIDRGSYSATSMFALSTLELDNLFLVGDTTGGGLGMPNGGQLPNSWIYRFSITRTLTPDAINYENGIPPDYYAVLDSTDMQQGYDTVIEKALDVLLKR